MGTLKTSGRIMKVEKTSEKIFSFGTLEFFLFGFVFSPLPYRIQRERGPLQLYGKLSILFCIV